MSRRGTFARSTSAVPTCASRRRKNKIEAQKYVHPDGEFLTFAAKFVLDVGVNIAFNYVTTGSFGVGGALKESAAGILNPAKTLVLRKNSILASEVASYRNYGMITAC